MRRMFVVLFVLAIFSAVGGSACGSGGSGGPGAPAPSSGY
jgi:hypothetical protein